MSITPNTVTITRRGERYTFNTATTLREELAKLRGKGADVIETLKDFKVAYIKGGELGRDDCNYDTIGTLGSRDGELDFTTGLGSGQRGNIDSSGQVAYRNSRRGSFPSGSDLYIEASYFTGKPQLGRAKTTTLTEALAQGVSPEKIVEDYYLGVAKPDSLKTLNIENRGDPDEKKVSIEGHFYNAELRNSGFRIGDWYIANRSGVTAGAISTSEGSSKDNWTVVLSPKNGETDFTTHMPLSEMTLEDVRAFLGAIGTDTDAKFYLGCNEQHLTMEELHYDHDAPRRNFVENGDWYGDYTTKKALTLAITNESTLETFGQHVWIDAETVKQYAPSYYSLPGGNFAEGALIATPDARILRVIEVTEKFIIAQHPAGHGETVALPITEGVEYKRVDEAVAASIL